MHEQDVELGGVFLLTMRKFLSGAFPSPGISQFRMAILPWGSPTGIS